MGNMQPTEEELRDWLSVLGKADTWPDTKFDDQLSISGEVVLIFTERNIRYLIRTHTHPCRATTTGRTGSTVTPGT